MLGFVEPALADDVVQDVFVKVVQGLPSFDGRAKLATWIHRVATNVGLNHLRSKRRRPAAARLSERAPLADRGPAPDAALAAEEERRAFERALAALPDEFRAVVVLRIHRKLSFDEIAAVLSIPRPTAESRMARAKEKLRALLGPLVAESAPDAARRSE